MYISIPISDGENAPLLGQSGAKQYRPPFTKGGEPIREEDGQKLLTVLAGPSPYQDYILPVVAAQGSALPKEFFRIVTNVKTQVPAPLQGLFTVGEGKLVGGTVDRWTRTIYAVEAPGLRGATRVEYALHESVHLFAHPVIPPKDCPRICVGTFQRRYGTGLGEGTTQAITEAIMDEQKISRYYHDRPYEVFTRPVRELIKCLSVNLFARAYFRGETREFTDAMESRWGKAWMQVVGLINTKKPSAAVEEIKKLEAARHKRLWQRGPKGDFPTPSRSTRFA